MKPCQAPKFYILYSIFLTLLIIGLLFGTVFVQTGLSKDSRLIFKEARQWQLAADTTVSWSTVATSTWTVPAGVTSITVKAWGAGGGGCGGGDNAPAAPGGTGGGGGYITGTVSVNPLENLTIVVGDDGKGGIGDVTNGGGGGGGAGYTIVGRGTNFYGTASTSILFLAAGGAGGGGGDDTTNGAGGAGGAGGGATGVTGTISGTANPAGTGGSQTAGGTGGAGTNGAGGNGSALNGGAGGGGTAVGAGGAGGANGGAKGGSGNAGGTDTGGGGGGGAGYFGGGGGGADADTDGASGGGGGSSFATSTATGVTNTAGSGVDPGNNSDSDYTASCSGLAVGGAAGAAGSGNGGVGTNGCVVIIYNTPPSFTAGPFDSPDPVNQGQAVTFEATSTDSESDSWYLAVCKTDSVTAGIPPSCASAGNTYCTSTAAVASGSGNTCSWTSTGTGAQTYYGFACDNSSIQARCSATTATSTGSVTVNLPTNNAPQVSSVSLNSGLSITLAENTSTSTLCTATIYDQDAGSEIASATGTIYRSGATNGPTCTDDDNDCYQISSGNCTLSAVYNTNYKNATCTDAVLFHADPTDAGSVYASQYWGCNIQATDTSSATGAATNTAQVVDVNTLLAVTVEGSINYGTLAPGATSSASQGITATTTGNVAVDVNVSGYALQKDSTTLIDVPFQEYSTLITFNYGSGTDLATSTAALELDLDKPRSSPATTSDIIYWRMEVPSARPPGTYSGTTTIDAKVD